MNIVHLNNKISLSDLSVFMLNGTSTKLTDVLSGEKTVLYFLRDSACVLTMYEIAAIQKQYEQFKKAGLQAVVCVQASPKCSKENLSDTYPFPVICDDTRALYELFEVRLAPDKTAMEGPNTLQRATIAREAGFIHGTDSGSPLQLPAVFYIDESGTIQYAYYGRTAEDVPTVTELLSVLS